MKLKFKILNVHKIRKFIYILGATKELKNPKDRLRIYTPAEYKHLRKKI